MKTAVNAEPQHEEPVGLGLPFPRENQAELARSTQDLKKAFRLVHDAYVRKGFMDPNTSRMRLCVYDALPMTRTIIVKKHHRVIGTLTLVPDNPLGLPLDKDFDTSAYRRTGRRVAEIMGLAVDAKYGGSGEVLFALFQKLLCLCVQDLDVEILQIAVSPIGAELYRFALRFKDVEEKVIADPLVKGAKMRALYLDVQEAIDEYPRRNEKSRRLRNLHNFFYESLGGQYMSGVKRSRKESAGGIRMSPEQLNYFFKERTDTIAKLTKEQHRLLRACYSKGQYERVLAPVPVRLAT